MQLRNQKQSQAQKNLKLAKVLLIIIVPYIETHALEYGYSIQSNFIPKTSTEDSLLYDWSFLYQELQVEPILTGFTMTQSLHI